MSDKDYGVCAACNGSQWRIVLVDHEDGIPPTPTVIPCAMCNKDGNREVGITLKGSVETKHKHHTDLRAKLEACENELAEMDASFELYDQSIRELTTFYHKEHPKEKEERRYPRTSKLVAWAVATIERERKYKRRAIKIARWLYEGRDEYWEQTESIGIENKLRELDEMEKDGGENV